MLFDIHAERAAQQTLYRLTGIPIEVWKGNMNRKCDYEFQDDFVEAMIDEYGMRKLQQSYMDFNFIFFHVTTSADECASIKRNGILDLKKAYECDDSELRRFLDDHGIIIDLKKAILTYQGQKYGIRYDIYPHDKESVEYKCWSIGHRFYQDFTICGFLSLNEDCPYGGQVHRRPEILLDIDSLLVTGISDEWEKTHIPYEIVAKVSGNNICCLFDDDAPESKKVMECIMMAYDVALNGFQEKTLILKNGVQILPRDILEIIPLSIWKQR